MIDHATTEAMWDILHDYVARQKQGEKVTAEEVHAELIEFLAAQEIELPAKFQGNVPFEVFDFFVDGGALFVTNSYPEEGPEQHTHPIFVECGSKLPSKILSAYPALADMLQHRFCPESSVAADAAEVETESAPAATGPFASSETGYVPPENLDDEIYQHVDIVLGNGEATGTGWVLSHKAKAGTILDLGDGRAWLVAHVYDGFVLNGAQMKRLPPTGYVTETAH
jgi:hypothetical protein